MRTLALLLVVACSTETPAPPPYREPTSTLTGKREHGMHHCPSGVPGSMTKMVATRDGVDVSITAGDADAQRRIVELAHQQERIGNPEGLNVHDGSHRGAGAIGFCPIIHANTSVVAEPAPGGVVIHVTTADPSKRDLLRKATAARIEVLAGIPRV
jgi:hypothetical protein